MSNSYSKQTRFEPRIWDTLWPRFTRPNPDKKWYAFDKRMNDFLYGVNGTTKKECVDEISKQLDGGILKFEKRGES